MKRTRPFRFPTTVLLAVSAVLILATGCSMVKSESDVLGEYELKVGNGRIALKVSPDKGFFRNDLLAQREGREPFGEMALG
jgi:hypothetical protein